ALLAAARIRLAAYDTATLTASSPATAGAALAEIVSDAASDAEITLGSVQLRGDSISRTALTRVGARASVSGELNGIALFLETLEGVPELLAIRELSITQSGQAGAPGQRETLRADLLVEGVWRNPERGARR
ncbi:MAG: GspMb/PilO family protein, partial [Gemmatimonadaceae bacterium]